MEEYNVEVIIQNILDNNKIWTIQEKMPLIKEEIDKLKTDMEKFLHNCDIDITAMLNEATDLCMESKDLIEEMEACKTEIEEKTMVDVLESIESHDKIAKELETVNFSLNIMSDIVQCGNFVKFFEEGRQAQSYSRAIESVYDLLQFTEHPSDGFNQLDIYKNTKKTGQLILDSLWHDLYQEWNRMVSYSSKPGTPETTITLNITLDDSLICIDVLNALDISKKLTEKIAEFATFLKKEVIIPMLQNECLVYAETEELAVISIHHNKSNLKPYYRDTIANMRILFEFLNNKFNKELANNKTIMKMFGSLICVELCDLMINECFVHTIPNTTNELYCYGRITSEIEDFQEFLVTINVFPAEGLSLLKYMDNIDVLFANCSSQYFLETARCIMLKDLSVTMSIGLEKVPDNATGSEQLPVEGTAAEALEIFEKTLPKSLFYFPLCLISKTAQELLDLVYLIMEQAVQCSDVVCKKLYHTVRLIFELYDAVVPYYHENYLQTIPQYVALFHNNCMYLAHNLQTLGDKWLSLMSGRELDYAIGFVDLVHKTRELGHKHLATHMQQQRKQILDNIRSSDLNCIVVKDILGDNAEAAVRQCLRQLQLLKNVWIGVFPSNVFTNLIATLVNMFVDELIHRVCTVEDISMEMATQLTSIYTLVVQKSPHLFQTPSDVEKYVKSWTKLQELIFVLGGSLKDIENHWNDGTGPLAIHFEKDELRSLIKALFQNTQFRANLLSKIK